jgi:hypothetical protein
MKIFPLTIYVLLKPFIQILPSDSKKSLWDSRTTATLVDMILINPFQTGYSIQCSSTTYSAQLTACLLDSCFGIPEIVLLACSSTQRRHVFAGRRLHVLAIYLRPHSSQEDIPYHLKIHLTVDSMISIVWFTRSWLWE